MKNYIYTIYCHINKANGKRYIGITTRAVKKRWKNGKGYSQQHQPVFFAAISKYGWVNFDHIILEENVVGHKLACDREKYWIAFYHTWVEDKDCMGYNMTPGGDYCAFLGRHHTEETKKKLSEIGKQIAHRKLTPEECQAISIRNKGYKHTDAAKIKIGLASKGRKLSAESCKKISEKKRSKPLSEAHKKALCKKHASPWKSIKIYCVELDQIFTNVDEASETLNINKNNIRNVCKGQRLTAGGYHWKFA